GRWFGGEGVEAVEDGWWCGVVGVSGGGGDPDGGGAVGQGDRVVGPAGGLFGVVARFAQSLPVVEAGGPGLGVGQDVVGVADGGVAPGGAAGDVPGDEGFPEGSGERAAAGVAVGQGVLDGVGEQPAHPDLHPVAHPGQVNAAGGTGVTGAG